MHTVFNLSSPEFSEHLDDHDFEPFIKGIAYLHFGQFFFEVKKIFFSLPLIGTYSSVSSFCLILCVFSMY